MIKLYTIGCPKCRVLEMQLNKAGIKYEIETNSDLLVEVGNAHNISSAPILEVDGNFLDFNAAIKYIKEVK